ncbi:MAG: GlxA family transcriptional regulator [Caulobacteraceae bacterium]
MTVRLNAADAAGRPARVAFLLISGFAMISYASAIEAVRAANSVARRELYSWHNVTCDGAPAVASNGVEIGPECSVRSSDKFDLVFVISSDEALAFRDPTTLRWLRQQGAAGAVIGGIGGGAFLLARAGLLNGYRLTVHWVYAPTFSEEFPEADLRRSLYEIDRNRITCGGGISSLDMMHALLRREHGEALALGVSEWFLHTDIREGQKPQRLSFQARLGVCHPGLIRALEAMENALEEPLDRTDLAAIAGVSERHLDRLFLSQIGTALSVYYLAQRLERARQLVQQSSLSLLEVAMACGFNRASTFSKSYRRTFNVAPSTDRSNALRRGRARANPPRLME